MCGISGYYSFHKSISSQNILEMNQAIRHRGPDDEGFWLYHNGQEPHFQGMILPKGKRSISGFNRNPGWYCFGIP
jgi:asparagine synthetase B (glutamine-hydrolysing)